MRGPLGPEIARGPAVFAAAIAAAAPGIAGVSVAGVALPTVLGYAISLGLSLATGILLRPKQPGIKGAGQQITIKQSSPARRRVYGRDKIAGAYYHFYNNWNLMQGVTFCDGPIDAIEYVWLDDLNTGLGGLFGGAQVFAYPFRGLVILETQYGTDTQGVSGLLAFFSGVNATYRLPGLVCVNMVCRPPFNFRKEQLNWYYPNGIPKIRIEARCSLVFDPRDVTQIWTDPTTWKWSDNSALCILDFLTHESGYQIPHDYIDAASFADFADLCDALRPDGVKLYRCWGGYDLTEAPKDVLNKLMSTCDAELKYTSSGKIKIVGGQWTEPTVTIEGKHVLSYEVQRGVERPGAYNQVRLRHKDQFQDYQVVQGRTFPVVDDVLAQAMAGGRVIERGLDLEFVPDNTQAAALAKIYMARDNPEWTFTLVTNAVGLDALGERIIRLQIDEIGLDETFLVKEPFDILVDGGVLTGVRLTLASFRAEAYAFAGFGGGTVAVPEPPPDPGVEDVAGFTVAVVTTTAAGGVTVSRIKVAVDPPVNPGLDLHAQYRAVGATDWIDMVSGGDWTALSDVVAVPDSYEVRAALRTFGGRDSTFAGPTTIVIDSASLGTIGQQLALGTNLDYGPVAEGVAISDDFGLLAAAPIASIDLGSIV